ncbi:oxidoreductase-like protein [Grosmannia clavigera kw1407]|uniref:Oxidoreductase-like protein n=1 Tax=Grosmannia clavigera (strain kw1407 / UAMH 11150) TaxID=655863 RepID=F0XM80_GROCL|nr:oxidoreductase-like protein [Grosmannia clavigera kw1407]EFX01324.1 oxidoreductase-like protein [Grosmannia clavigera kw1407]
MTEIGREVKESHLERTAAEPRDRAMHSVILSDIQPVGRTIRVLRLQIPPGSPDIQFLPGQWIDTFCPGVTKAGGFTITSAPSRAVSRQDGHPCYIELAVRQASDNPAAEWLWQPAAAILGDTLQVRVGGSFVFPPPSLGGSPTLAPRARFVFVAGGVGINPLISMLSYLGDQQEAAPVVEMLYSTREEESLSTNSKADDDSPASRVLFLDRLASLFSTERLRGKLQLFLTGGSIFAGLSGKLMCNGLDVSYGRKRITTADLDAAVLGGLGTGEDHASIIKRTYVYVCGVPAMTDAFVAHLTASRKSGGLGLPLSNVLYEKWW